MAKISRRNVKNMIANSIENSSIEQRFLLDLNYFIKNDVNKRELSKTYKPSVFLPVT